MFFPLKRKAGVLVIAASILSISPFSAFATENPPDFSACSHFFYKGFAPTPSAVHPGKRRALCFSGFAVFHSGQSKTPIYVAEYLTRERLDDAKDEKRTNKFYEEARLPKAERATLADYKGSGLDRGHMAPAADMPTPEAMAQSFSLANMVPQAREHNRGIWAKAVERSTRHYAMRSQAGVYVLTGPLYKKGMPADLIGEGKVWVPGELFKLVYDPVKSRAWAFVSENRDDAMMQKPIPYPQLVQRLGYSLLPAGVVPD